MIRERSGLKDHSITEKDESKDEDPKGATTQFGSFFEWKNNIVFTLVKKA